MREGADTTHVIQLDSGLGAPCVSLAGSVPDLVSHRPRETTRAVRPTTQSLHRPQLPTLILAASRVRLRRDGWDGMVVVGGGGVAGKGGGVNPPQLNALQVPPAGPSHMTDGYTPLQKASRRHFQNYRFQGFPGLASLINGVSSALR